MKSEIHIVNETLFNLSIKRWQEQNNVPIKRKRTPNENEEPQSKIAKTSKEQLPPPPPAGNPPAHLPQPIYMKISATDKFHYFKEVQFPEELKNFKMPKII